jgi:hypothetical protein
VDDPGDVAHLHQQSRVIRDVVEALGRRRGLGVAEVDRVLVLPFHERERDAHLVAGTDTQHVRRDHPPLVVATRTSSPFG